MEEFQFFITSSQSLAKIFLVMALMFINWSLEAWKWKLMMNKIEQVPFLKSLQAVFSGLTISFFTPNRIGEYAGRVFHLKTANRIQATLVTILENFSQLIVTLIAGSIAMLFYIQDYLSLHAYLNLTITVALLIFIVMVLVFYYQVPLFDAWLVDLRFMKRLKKYFDVLANYSKTELSRVLLLSVCRFLVFTFQYYLLLEIFGIQVSFMEAAVLISMIFFVITLIPTFALSEVGVRGAVATYFLSRVSYDTVAILNSSVALWIINLVIPSLIGIIFIFRFRFYRQTK
jgi:uncharacterized membrane protein YbhN (UPF0104 family)